MTNDSALGSKRPYAAPKMIVYGDMVTLTKVGTGSKVENATNMVASRRP